MTNPSVISPTAEYKPPSLAELKASLGISNSVQTEVTLPSNILIKFSHNVLDFASQKKKAVELEVVSFLPDVNVLYDKDNHIMFWITPQDAELVVPITLKSSLNSYKGPAAIVYVTSKSPPHYALISTEYGYKTKKSNQDDSGDPKSPANLEIVDYATAGFKYALMTAAISQPGAYSIVGVSTSDKIKIHGTDLLMKADVRYIPIMLPCRVQESRWTTDADDDYIDSLFAQIDTEPSLQLKEAFVELSSVLSFNRKDGYKATPLTSPPSPFEAVLNATRQKVSSPGELKTLYNSIARKIKPGKITGA